MTLKTAPVIALFTALLCILTIIAHELAHFAAAIAMGGQNVALHWADITFAPGSLDATGLAVTWAAGPIITHLIILWVWLRGRADWPALALGLGAATRNMILLPFTLKFLLGHDVSGFTNDEVTVADALAMSPLPLALFATALGWSAFVLFLARAKRSGGWALLATLLVGTILGIASWGAIGPILLPGGKGFG